MEYRESNRSGWRKLTAFVVVIALLTGCGGSTADDAVTPDEARTLAREAYLFGFPTVMNFKTMASYVLDENSPEYKGPFNHLACDARLLTPADKTVVTPNSDTPYCMFWLDLRAEPMVLSVPEVEPDRFYHFQLIDLYTHNFAYVGSLTTGTGAGRFLIAGPDHDGSKPDGIDAVIPAETEFVFSVVRTQLFGPDDLERVAEIQADFGLQPLSAFLGTDAPAAPPAAAWPQWEEGAQFDERFFGYLDFMMFLLEKPAAGREDLWSDLARLGLGTEGDFDFAAQPADIQAAMKEGIKEGFGEIEKFLAAGTGDPLASVKMFGTREFLAESAAENFGLDNADLLRSAAAHMGLYGNSGSEATYPTYLVDAGGKPLDGSAHRYTMTFAADALPPVKSFWSLSIYDGQTQLFIENPLDRYLLNSAMLDQFVREADGSLVLHVGKESPGAELENNWLPAPDGPFYCAMRLYGPKPEALDGSWTPPALVRVE